MAGFGLRTSISMVSETFLPDPSAVSRTVVFPGLLPVFSLK